MIRIKIYSSASALTTTNVATLSAAQGADASPFELRCLALDPQWNLQGDKTETAGGYNLSALGMLFGMTVRSYPLYYGDSSGKYGESLPTLISKISSLSYLYIQFVEYGQDNIFLASPTTQVAAVALTGIDYEHNHEFGYKIVTLSFDAYRSS